jgi:chromosome segregation ATPase
MEQSYKQHLQTQKDKLIKATEEFGQKLEMKCMEYEDIRRLTA